MADYLSFNNKCVILIPFVRSGYLANKCSASNVNLPLPCQPAIQPLYMQIVCKCNKTIPNRQQVSSLSLAFNFTDDDDVHTRLRRLVFVYGYGIVYFARIE